MRCIDIRRPDVPVDHIIFSDANGSADSYYLTAPDESGFMISNVAEARQVRIRTADIDNLILALQKAREVWGNMA